MALTLVGLGTHTIDNLPLCLLFHCPNGRMRCFSIIITSLADDDKQTKSSKRYCYNFVKDVLLYTSYSKNAHIGVAKLGCEK